MVDHNEIATHVGRNPTATFEVHRATDTEKVETDPNSVIFAKRTCGPVVMLNYSKYHSGLPPWEQLESFTLDGDGTAMFTMPEYLGKRITGDLKTVEICSPVVQFG